jgi:hypothetical protein
MQLTKRRQQNTKQQVAELLRTLSLAINWLRGGEDVAQKRKRILLQLMGRGEAERGQQQGKEGHRDFRSARKKEER